MRGNGFHEVIEKRVDDSFVECAMISEREQIEFEGFAFQALPIRHVANPDVSEIRLSGDGADGGEFGAVELDPVGAVRMRVVEGFQNGGTGLGFENSRALSESLEGGTRVRHSVCLHNGSSRG